MLFCKCLQECPSVWGRCGQHTLWRAPACGCLLAHSLSSCAGMVAAQAVSAGRVSTHRACLVRGSESTSCTCLQGHFVLRGAGHRQDTDGEGAGGINRPALAQDRWRSSRARAPTASANLAGRPSAPCACCSKRCACSLQQRIGLRRLRITVFCHGLRPRTYLLQLAPAAP